MMFDYILVTIRRDKERELSVLRIRIFDPADASETTEPKDPYEFSEQASAYTEHGIPLKRGAYPWGDSGDLFPYSDEVYYRLSLFGQKNDVEGYAAFFGDEASEYLPGINYNEE